MEEKENTLKDNFWICNLENTGKSVSENKAILFNNFTDHFLKDKKKEKHINKTGRKKKLKCCSTEKIICTWRNVGTQQMHQIGAEGGAFNEKF